MRSFAGASELTRAQLRDAPVHWPRPSVLDASLKILDGVGPKLAEAAAEAGIATVGDLLLRIPHSHRDRIVRPVAELEVGQQATIQVEVLGAQPRPFRRRGSQHRLGQGRRRDRARCGRRWFNQPWVAPKLTPGTRLLLTGSRDRRGFRVSEYELNDPPALFLSVNDDGEGTAERRRSVPVHPATEKLESAADPRVGGAGA